MKWSGWLLFSLLMFPAKNILAADPLTIWTSSENVKNAIDSITPAFEKKFKHPVKVIVLNKDLTTQFKTASLSGKGPDILCWAHDVIGELAESGFVEPLMLPPKLKSKFLKVSLDAFTYKGNLYAYPYDIEAIALVYNKALIPSVPESMEELLSLSEELNSPNDNRFAFLYDINNFFFSFPFFSTQGGYIFGSKNDFINVKDVGLANEGALEGMRFLKGLVDSKLVPPSTDRSIAFNKMVNGNLAFTIDGPWALNELQKSGIEFGITPIPLWKGKIPRPFVGSHGFIIRRSSPNKELAKELVEKFLVTKKGILTLYKHDPRGPSREDAVNELSLTSPHLRAFMESAKNGLPMPNVPEMGIVWQSMGAALSLVLSGESTPEKALKEAKLQIESALAR